MVGADDEGPDLEHSQYAAHTKLIEECVANFSCIAAGRSHAAGAECDVGEDKDKDRENGSLKEF